MERRYLSALGEGDGGSFEKRGRRGKGRMSFFRRTKEEEGGGFAHQSPKRGGGKSWGGGGKREVSKKGRWGVLTLYLFLEEGIGWMGAGLVEEVSRFSWTERRRGFFFRGEKEREKDRRYRLVRGKRKEQNLGVHRKRGGNKGTGESRRQAVLGKGGLSNCHWGERDMEEEGCRLCAGRTLQRRRGEDNHETPAREKEGWKGRRKVVVYIPRSGEKERESFLPLP